MVWIHEQTDWPHFTWNETKLSQQLADIRYRQGKLLGRMESLGFDLQQEASLKVLTNDIVKSSAIEGEMLDPQEVRSSLAKRLGLDISGTPPTSRHVEGIVEMMLDATQNYNLPLTTERLFDWHGALFPTGRSGLRRITVAAWRPAEAGDMQVVSGPFGREKIHFQAPSSLRLHNEMKLFLDWFEKCSPIDPVLKSALAHLWFVTIHPFEDGNGRIARAIADMALARADGCRNRFYSMSSQLESERKSYYQALELQQRSSLCITPWLNWFLGCLGRAIKAAETILENVLYKAEVWSNLKGLPINHRQKIIITKMLDDFKGPMTNAKYAKIAKCSGDTALRDIRTLMEYGVLTKNPNAGGRSTSYSLSIVKNTFPN